MAKIQIGIQNLIFFLVTPYFFHINFFIVVFFCFMKSHPVTILQAQNFLAYTSLFRHFKMEIYILQINKNLIHFLDSHLNKLDWLRKFELIVLH